MNQDMELQDLLASIAEKSLHILAGFKPKPQQLSALIEQLMTLSIDFQTILSSLFKNPEHLLNMQFNFLKDSIGLFQSQMNSWFKGKSIPIEDKRFSGSDWHTKPFYHLLSQHYILVAQHINTLFSSMNFGDANTTKRITFFTGQLLDALSPDNCLFTNPELIDATLKSRGKNLLKGLNNLLCDLEKNPSHPMIAMTDKRAFHIGENIAATPGHVIFKNDLMELIQYAPQTNKVKAIPLLIIPPWINKYYILDLSQHNSFIHWLVTQGITVFVISWVNPDKSYADKSLYDYLHEGPMSAIDVIQKQLHVKQVNALGFCIGGTLLSMLLAYDAHHQNTRVKTATFLASMIDFCDPGDISVFIDDVQVTQLEKKMKETGYLEGHLMTSTFNSLRARDLIWSFFIKNYLLGQTPAPFDILYWNSDATNMPETMHSQYLRWMYLNNDLIKPNHIVLNGTPLAIQTIKTPSYFISTQKDHIAPWKTVYAGFQLLSGEKHFLLGGSGHIAGIIIPPGSEKYGFYLNTNHPLTPDDWLHNASHHTGSWWPEWFSWLCKASGRPIDTKDMSQLAYQPLYDAPGHYILRNND